MASSGRNYDRGARFQRLLRRDPMRTGYVLVSEERESGSEYSGSTCCCSSCASSCSSSESSDDEDDDDDDAYLSDCSACWARRDALRRGRAGWREGDEGGHGETRQRGGQQGNGNSSRNNNGSPNINTNTTATPAYRNLTERILATTRRLHQEEENRRHFRSWMRVLEDVQRRSHTSYRSNSNSNAAPGATVAAAAAAAAVGQGSSSSAAAVGRVPPRAGAGEEAPVRRRTTHVYSYPPRAAARGYFMSGGRSISSNRRRRL
ncbi:hypothetical protein M431DRAFT_533072 [Trichoderma harzianum CBS 226.95]|uniref:Uncharacterized protein n=1 Tax=Trichoderma harzianum CBS 226.95 TaxID=983964 RepID=A0A2T4A3I0_TRIHA|nr:hypothetical protein M431DRAFT_533072 [Trichoderma harzianum CBS 226.95]PTB51620.1 hypothetical protein M431DRAFT_533072 [Trichoderma harzianum CBS 226.95]